jgi:integrase
MVRRYGFNCPRPFSKGHSLKAVSQRLGHANPTMTLRVYAHAMPNDDAKLVEGLAQVMT